MFSFGSKHSFGIIARKKRQTDAVKTYGSRASFRRTKKRMPNAMRFIGKGETSKINARTMKDKYTC